MPASPHHAGHVYLPALRRLGFFASLAMLIACVGCAKETEKPPVSQAPPATTIDSPPAATDTPATGDVPEGSRQADQSETENRVLRHAVFFKFKDSSSEADVRQVVDAFRALPAKIDTIVDFKWGTNNSPEGLNDEFTHVFLLTFNDETGRDVYLPHAEHKAFGDVLRPHMEKVFVIDYWGAPPEDALEKELKHAVFFKFKADAPPENVKAVEEGFAALPGKIDTIKHFEWGTNNSPEKKNDEFTHCFMVTFDSEEGRAAYLPHPEHEAFVEVLKPVMDKVRVIDFWAQQ